MKTNFVYAGLSHIGEVRDTNEDRWTVRPATGLFCVSDGMGGGPFGAMTLTVSSSQVLRRNANSLSI